ncbi:SBBP repeat-containing protein [Nitrospira sp. NS4]|uniref:DUF7948 domain-containing protein n=1 Tax=Nitrospira sp. NS4 TaxID=3414498 RepID=UPI003C2E7FD3
MISHPRLPLVRLHDMKVSRPRLTLLKGLTFAVVVSLAPAATLWANSPKAVEPPASTARVQSAYGRLPLSFEANQGQWDPSVQFVTRGPGHQLFLTPKDAVLALRTRDAKGEGRGGDINQSLPSSSPSPTSQSVVRMKFDGANPQAEIVGLDKLPGIVNYILGEDPSKWRTNIPTYQKVEYKDVYPGVDLVYYGNQGQLEYDFIVAPGADPKQITLAFEGVETIGVDEKGDLVLTAHQLPTDTALGSPATLRMHKPVVYQRDVHGHKHVLAGTYVLLAAVPAGLQASEMTHVAFQVASYDASLPLIIDPVLSWSTYLGGSDHDWGYGIAVDQAGQAYVTGRTRTPGSGFPGTSGSLIQSTFGGSGETWDAFVAKLNAAGTALLYSTYLGTSRQDEGRGIAVDTAGNAYVTGATSGSGFPGTASSLIQSTFGGGNQFDAFVVKLNAAGTALVYATYLGTSAPDWGYGIAVDQAGQAYVTGTTQSGGSSFPGTAGSLIQSTHSASSSDAFVTKINTAGTAIVYSTYLGGYGGTNRGTGIAVDLVGNAYVTGDTFAAGSNFPGTAGSLIQNTSAGGGDAFVAKINAEGTALVYATYLGTSVQDHSAGIAVDSAGNAYVTGLTSGLGFPGTVGSLIQSTFAGGDYDAFVTKLNSTGTAIVYSTYLGGSGFDEGQGIAVDTIGQAYVTGATSTPGSGFPGTGSSPIQSVLEGDSDGFVAKLNASGTGIVYSSYLGSSGQDTANAIASDSTGNVYVTGWTRTLGTSFPGTANSLIQGIPGGADDAFVAKITTNDSPVCSAAQAMPTTLWSPDHQLVPIAVTGVTDPDGDAVTITVTGVTQDEPVKSTDSDNMSPDAAIQAGFASVRAERSGKGNGRVYQLSFRAEDGKGGFCTGAVKVGVPLSLKKGLTAVDDGQVYDSTIP